MGWSVQTIPLLLNLQDTLRLRKRAQRANQSSINHLPKWLAPATGITQRAQLQAELSEKICYQAFSTTMCVYMYVSVNRIGSLRA